MFVRFFICFCILLSSCDFINPRKSFKIAVAQSDLSYGYAASHLKKFLEIDGYNVELMPVKTVLEASQLVASGKADLTMMMNQSKYLPRALDQDANRIRTILPLFDRYFFLFARKPMPDTLTAANVFSGKRIGLEFLNGETKEYIAETLSDANVKDVSFVMQDGNPDFVHFWGTHDGPRSTGLLQEGWFMMSLNPAWVRFIQLEDPTLKPFALPPPPTSGLRQSINTLVSQTILVCNASLGENTIFQLSNTIFQNKARLQGYDNQYRHISENFDADALLFPLHSGAEEYLQRKEPSFIERYADALALLLSMIALAYGGITAIRTNLQRRKKEHIDLFFLELLEIRSKNLSSGEKSRLLDELHRRAIVLMTNEKIDKTDFHIFSRLAQQEIALLK
jgi:TRAP-type uncharacterized transport system substrate-binding protein